MNSWKLVPFGELVDDIRDIVTIKNDDLAYVGLEHMDSNSLELRRVASPAKSISSNLKFHPGDILFGKLRPALRKCVHSNISGYCSTDILVLRPRGHLHNRFVAWLAASDQVFLQAIRRSEGTRMPRTSWRVISCAPVHLPEISEQRRIAEALDVVEERIAHLRRLVDKYSKMRTGLLVDNLRAPTMVDITAGWVRLSLAEVVPTVDYGISHALKEEPTGTPVLRMNNVGEGRAGFGEIKYCAENLPSKLYLQYGDVLFNRTNSIDHVGRSGMWREEMPRATFASYLVRLNVDPSRLLPEYLALWLSHPVTRQRVRALSTPAVQQVNVNPTRLRSLPIDLPESIDEQRRIAGIVETADTQITHANAELAKLRMLKQGLMHDLLTGKVRVTRSGELTG